MKIYTKGGDGGETGLPGRRLRKDDALVRALGELDELNSNLGWARVVAPLADPTLEAAQSILLDLGADLARGNSFQNPGFVERLEAEIDSVSEGLPALTQFILPGGTEAAARLHLGRSVCRRAERSLVECGAGPGAISALNRLSDWLFVMARRENAAAGFADRVWSKTC